MSLRDSVSPSPSSPAAPAALFRRFTPAKKLYGKPTEMGFHWLDSPAGITQKSTTYGKMNPQRDLGLDQGYTQILSEQYNVDVRRNPVLEVLAGVFRHEAPTPSGQGPNSPVHHGLVDIERCAGGGSMVNNHARGLNHLHVPIQPTPHQSTSSIPSTSAARSSYEKNHICTYCGTAFDRSTRARDCRNMDLGLTPHQCLGRCGMPGW
jgi:hypothetical protein